METTQNSFKLLKKIKDPVFSIENLEYYNLTISIGDRDMQVLVSDTRDNRSLLLEDYMFPVHKTAVEKVEILKDLYEDHHLLIAGFWHSVTVSFKNKYYSFIPSDFYEGDFASNYLQLNSDYDTESHGIISTNHKKIGFVNIFSAPKRIIKFFISRYPNIKIRYVHQSSGIINGIAKKSKGKQGVLAIFIDRFVMHLTYFKEGSMVFYNQYPIKKFEDYLRYLQIASKELSIPFEGGDILLYGYLGKKTPHYAQLKSLIDGLKLGTRPKNMHFGYVFDEIADHQYFDLFALYASVSKK